MIEVIRVSVRIVILVDPLFRSLYMAMLAIEISEDHVQNWEAFSAAEPITRS